MLDRLFSLRERCSNVVLATAVERIFGVRGIDFKRTAAFALVYFAVFVALTLLDGVAIALFVKRVGAEELPRYFGIIAVANMVAVGAYVCFAERFSSVRVFVGLALSFGLCCFGAWWALSQGATEGLSALHGGLYAARELFQALFLLHFGTFLQRFFTRGELKQTMALVYAGGRIGGMLGGAILTHGAESLGLVNLLLVGSGVAVWVAVSAVIVNQIFPVAKDQRDDESAKALHGAGSRSAVELDRQARSSIRGFLDAIVRSPFLKWHSLSAVAYIGCRYVLAYQYSNYFQDHFADEVALAAFLGTYTQIALAASLVIQLVLVSRLIRWVGLRGVQFGYAASVCVALVGAAWFPSLGVAILGRFTEQELRLGLRNPSNQICLNFLSRTLRVRVRSWNAGVVTPVATLGTSAALGLAASVSWMFAIPALGIGAGLAFLYSNRKMNLSYDETSSLQTAAASARAAAKQALTSVGANAHSRVVTAVHTRARTLSQTDVFRLHPVAMSSTR